MKTAGASLIAYLASLSGKAGVWRADLITLTLVDGATAYYWTTADFDITTGGHTYKSGGGGSAPVVVRGPYSQSLGVQVDTFDVDLSGPFTIGGVALNALAVAGYFDGARISVGHVVGAYPGDLSLGVMTWLEGPVSIPKPNGTTLSLRCKSQTERLNFRLPRFLLQAQCGNALYDANCTIVRATWTIAGTVSTATTTTVTTATAGIVAKADNYFNLGVLTFTSGALSGASRAVADWVHSTGVITLATALPSAPAASDGFNIYPGCDRSYTTCRDRYSNLAHHRGFWSIPTVEAGS
jgi:uncharacterized phage protein (TIGR02218 family)